MPSEERWLPLLSLLPIRRSRSYSKPRLTWILLMIKVKEVELNWSMGLDEIVMITRQTFGIFITTVIELDVTTEKIVIYAFTLPTPHQCLCHVHDYIQALPQKNSVNNEEFIVRCTRYYLSLPRPTITFPQHWCPLQYTILSMRTPGYLVCLKQNIHGLSTSLKFIIQEAAIQQYTILINQIIWSSM